MSTLDARLVLRCYNPDGWKPSYTKPDTMRWVRGICISRDETSGERAAERDGASDEDKATELEIVSFGERSVPNIEVIVSTHSFRNASTRKHARTPHKHSPERTDAGESMNASTSQ